MGDRSFSLSEMDPVVLGYKSGALYESMLVVEMSSTGAEILAR